MEDITEPKKKKKSSWCCSFFILIALGTLGSCMATVGSSLVTPDDSCQIGGVGLYTLVVGPGRTNCYIVVCEETKEAMVVDPGAEPHRIISTIKWNDWKLSTIVITHSHSDHNLGAASLHQSSQAVLYRHKKADAAILATKKRFLKEDVDKYVVAADEYLAQGDTVEFGNLSFEVIHTPGHSPGGLCLYREGILFSGDTLFKETVGRTDFIGGSQRQLISSIRNKLLNLPDVTVVLPGHGPTTTIGHERKNNPYL